jgi:hypothetical protein
MSRTLQFTSDKPPANLWIRLLSDVKIEDAGNGSYKIDGRWTLRVKAKGKAVARADGSELLIPVTFENNRAEIQLTYDW